MVEVSDDLARKVFSAIELAHKTGSIKKGANEVTKAGERGKAKLVAIASDANPKEIIMHIPIICKEKNIPCVHLASKQELGASAGIEVSTVAIAVLEEGDAKRDVQEIAQTLSQLV